MKLTITCEKCGGVIMEGEGYKDAEHLRRRFTPSNFGGYVLPHHECPKDKLTYGPLTEEMVADALFEAMYHSKDESVPDAWRGLARFVLRLLDQSIAIGLKDRDDSNTITPWREWLLDLARNP